VSESPTIATVLKDAIGVAALCLGCGHNSELNMDRTGLPSHITLIQAAERFKCSNCGSKEIILGAVRETSNVNTRPDYEDFEIAEPNPQD
jgi:DNA-directed RNA polymerase subunit RPC12/RpoP